MAPAALVIAACGRDDRCVQREIEPDDKDWTWVLERPCPECGLDAGSVRFAEVAERIRANAAAWLRVLTAPGTSLRPEPGVWSPTEYAAHVRDVHATFAGRLRLMLAEDDPGFANWDQDAAAREHRYDLADPAAVALELEAAAGEVAAAYDRVPDVDLERPGRRSNGSAFTVRTLSQYHLHDVVHHLRDVAPDGGGPHAPGA